MSWINIMKLFKFILLTSLYVPSTLFAMESNLEVRRETSTQVLSPGNRFDKETILKEIYGTYAINVQNFDPMTSFQGNPLASLALVDVYLHMVGEKGNTLPYRAILPKGKVEKIYKAKEVICKEAIKEALMNQFYFHNEDEDTEKFDFSFNINGAPIVVGVFIDPTTSHSNEKIKIQNFNKIRLRDFVEMIKSNDQRALDILSKLFSQADDVVNKSRTKKQIRESVINKIANKHVNGPSATSEKENKDSLRKTILDQLKKNLTNPESDFKETELGVLIKEIIIEAKSKEVLEFFISNLADIFVQSEEFQNNIIRNFFRPFVGHNLKLGIVRNDHSEKKRTALIHKSIEGLEPYNDLDSAKVHYAIRDNNDFYYRGSKEKDNYKSKLFQKLKPCSSSLFFFLFTQKSEKEICNFLENDEKNFEYLRMEDPKEKAEPNLVLDFYNKNEKDPSRAGIDHINICTGEEKMIKHLKQKSLGRWSFSFEDENGTEVVFTEPNNFQETGQFQQNYATPDSVTLAITHDRNFKIKRNKATKLALEISNKTQSIYEVLYKANRTELQTVYESEVQPQLEELEGKFRDFFNQLTPEKGVFLSLYPEWNVGCS